MLRHSMTAPICWAVAAAGSLQAHAPDRPPPAYQILDLGTLGGLQSAALDINESGTVSGWAERESGERAGFRYERGFRMVPLLYWSGQGSAANALSDFGEEACGWGVGDDGQQRALYWLFDEIVEIGMAEGQPSEALDVNDFGIVVGWLDGRLPVREAFTWTLAEGYRPLPALAYGPTEARAINEVGQVAGVSEYYDSGFRAVLWNGGEIMSLDTLGGLNSAAEGINNLGEVVGESDVIGYPPASRAFLWLPAPAYGREAGLHDLGTLPELLCSRAWEINDAGTIVGEAYDREDRAPARALIWTPTAGLRDLNELISADEDWHLLCARAVNNRGEIAGYGLHAGAHRAFLLLPVPTGDLDASGCVDQADLALLLSALGQSQRGDIDGDGDTDMMDLALLIANLGLGCE